MIFKLKWLKKYFEKDGNQFDNIREGKEDSGFRIEADADENTPNKDVIKFDGEVDVKTFKNLRPIWWKFTEEEEEEPVEPVDDDQGGDDDPVEGEEDEEEIP